MKPLSPMPVHTTILSDVEPLSTDELRDATNKWAERILDNAIEYAKGDNQFARSLCKKVISAFGRDDGLAGLIGKELRAERSGKPKGRQRKWTDARYFWLLTEYEALKQGGTKREKILELLAEKENFSGVNRSDKIEEKISKARKIVQTEDLPDFCRPPNSHNKGG